MPDRRRRIGNIGNNLRAQTTVSELFPLPLPFYRQGFLGIWTILSEVPVRKKSWRNTVISYWCARSFIYRNNLRLFGCWELLGIIYFLQRVENKRTVWRSCLSIRIIILDCRSGLVIGSTLKICGTNLSFVRRLLVICTAATVWNIYRYSPYLRIFKVLFHIRDERVCPSACISLAAMGRILVKFDIGDFNSNMLRKSRFILKSDKTARHFT
jgi:hypothetical protein